MLIPIHYAFFVLNFMLPKCIINLILGKGTQSNTTMSSCIYTVHLTRSFNRQTNICTQLVFYLLKLI